MVRQDTHEKILNSFIFGESNFLSSEKESLFQNAVGRHDENIDHVNYYEIFLPNGGPLKAITEETCIATDFEVAFINAVRPVTQNNKEALANLLDFAAEKGCNTLLACVQKDTVQFKSIMSSFMYVGFSICSDRNIPGFVLLGIQL